MPPSADQHVNASVTASAAASALTVHPSLRPYDPCPAAVRIAIHALKLAESARPALVKLAFGAARHPLPVAPYAQCATFSLSFHKLVFDTLKLDVYERGLLTTRRIASVRIRIARSLPTFTGSYIHAFTLVDPRRQSEALGSIELSFTFFDSPQHPACAESQLSTLVAAADAREDANLSGNESDCESEQLDHEDCSNRQQTTPSSDQILHDADAPSATDFLQELAAAHQAMGISDATPSIASSVTISDESANDSSSTHSIALDKSSSNLTAVSPAHARARSRVRLLATRGVTSSTSTASSHVIRSITALNLPRSSASTSTHSVDANHSPRRRTLLGFSDHTRTGLSELSEITSAFFGTGWKISKTDLAAAMILMNEYYRKHHTPRKHDFVTDDKQLRVAAYFIDFALVTYGAVAMNFFGYGRGYIRDMLRFDQDRKMAIDHLRISPSDLLVWEFGSPELYKPNFFIVRDTRTKSIIVSIRGTFNIHDCLTDLNTEYVPFLDGLTHKGFLSTARWIRDNYLDRILGWLKEYNAKALYFVGHSLGGSAASLLFMENINYIRSNGPPDLITRVYNFGGPPCVSRHVSDRFEDFIDTFVNENDFVPRICYGAMLDFRDLVLLASSLLKKSNMTTQDRIDALHKHHVEIRSTNVHPHIHIPGKIYYLYKIKTSEAPSLATSAQHAASPSNSLIKHTGKHYVVERNNSDAFDFHIRPKMLFHHLANKYDNSLRGAHDWVVEWKKKNQITC